MILILQKNTPEPAIRQLLAQLSLQNVKGGCVAGDNTIMCAVRTVDDTIILMDKLKKIVEGK